MEVHQSLNETMHLLMKVLKSTSSYLLTYSWLPWMHRVNKWKALIGQNDEEYSSLNLARKLYTANELIFAEYCEFHACRKREI